MEQIKTILRLLFIKYWFLFALLVFTLALKFSLQEYYHQEDSPRYYARLSGATAVIAETTLSDYLDPIAKSISTKDYHQAANLLHLPIEQVKTIKGFFSKVNMIIAEKDVRYEFVVFADFFDTIYVQKIEDSLTKYLSTNPMLRRDFETKEILYNKEQEVLKSEMHRVDSMMSLEKNKSVYQEHLFARKAELKIALAQSDEKFKRYYEIEKIVGFRKSMLVFQPQASFVWQDILKWFFGGIIIEFLLILWVDKDLQEKIKSKTSQSL